jgi:hypothetical protein
MKTTVWAQTPTLTHSGAFASYVINVSVREAPDGYYWRLRNNRYHLVRRPKWEGSDADS